jgi:hypothetical protein
MNRKVMIGVVMVLLGALAIIAIVMMKPKPPEPIKL